VKNVFAGFEKCSNYAVMATVVMRTITSMNRFKSVPRDSVISSIFAKLKERAAK